MLLFIPKTGVSDHSMVRLEVRQTIYKTKNVTPTRSKCFFRSGYACRHWVKTGSFSKY